MNELRIMPIGQRTKLTAVVATVVLLTEIACG